MKDITSFDSKSKQVLGAQWRLAILYPAFADNEAHFVCDAEWLNRFVNVHLQCFVNSLKRINKMSTLLHEKISAYAHDFNHNKMHLFDCFMEFSKKCSNVKISSSWQMTSVLEREGRFNANFLFFCKFLLSSTFLLLPQHYCSSEVPARHSTSMQYSDIFR